MEIKEVLNVKGAIKTVLEIDGKSEFEQEARSEQATMSKYGITRETRRER